MRRLAGCTKGSMSRFAALLLAFVSLGGFAAASVAAPYPERPVKMIVPYPAGGSTDGTARLVAQKLSEMWGQAVVVDNRPGADTQIGNSAVASAAPDGYTLLVIATTFAISKSLYPSLPYDPARDFTPIASVAIAPFYLIVGSGSPAKTVGGANRHGRGRSRQAQLCGVERDEFHGGGADETGCRHRRDAHPLQGRRACRRGGGDG